MRYKQLHKSFCFIVLTVLLLIVTVISGGFTVPAFADTDRYSNVLDDLSKDKDFNSKDYPVKVGDYTPRVIQIAESADKELYIYVYHACGQTKAFLATSINISTTLYESLHYENYELELLNSDGTLYKYKVKDFEVKAHSVRYYDISSIYRKWNSGINGSVSEEAFAVGQKWTASTSGGEVTYNMEEVEVLDVTKQFVHFIRYNDGFQWGGIKACDAHYFAFNCDHEIDTLISADLQFYTQEYKRMEGQDIKLLDERTKHYVTVDYTMQGASKKEKWQRMSSTSDFLSDMGDKVSSDEANKIKQYDWIINFYETEYERDVGGKDILITLLVPGGFIWGIVDACTTYGVAVTDVTLMRLEFEYNGKIYNMGVVSDKQSGSILPPIPDVKDIPWWVWLIVAIVVLVALVIVLQVLGLFMPVIKFIFSALWWVICLPFRGIKALINKIRGE